MGIAEFFAKPAVKYGGLALLALLLVGGTLLAVRAIYSKGATAGGNEVTTQVQSETIHRLDDARTRKEQADDEVRRTPYDDRVDGLR